LEADGNEGPGGPGGGVVNQSAPAFTGDVDRTFQLFVKLFETTYFGAGLLD
jgi:hypothetical protein